MPLCTHCNYQTTEQDMIHGKTASIFGAAAWACPECKLWNDYILRKLMIRTWFGELPPWTEKFLAHVKHLEKHGWDFLLVTDLEGFKERCREKLGVLPDPRPGTRKAGDYDPMLGRIFSDELDGYDYWGHFNLDCVYGRLNKWIPDSFLQNIDIFGNDPGAMCGPFSVYRNTPKVNNLFKDDGVAKTKWEHNVQTPDFLGWDELDFSRIVTSASLRGKVNFVSGHLQSHDKMPGHEKRVDCPHVAIGEDGTLTDLVTMRETMMFHFNRVRQWPA